MSSMVIFQIGPVQEFIQTARKTQDYWAGSFLLSYLNARAIHAFTQKGSNNTVIFPAVNQNPLYMAATPSSGAPWDPTKAKGSMAAFTPSLPNRFFGMSDDDDPKAALEAAKEAVVTSWTQIAKEVKESFFAKTRASTASPGASRSVSVGAAAQALENFTCPPCWDDQIMNRAFEILYAWRKTNNNYRDDYRAVEEWMGARKASRIFAPLESQQGYVCSLCGLRTAIYPSGCKTRREVRDWWENTVRGRKNLKYRFRQGEHLCAVCIVKRLAPFEVFKTRSAEIPSTSTMAATTYHKEVLARLPRIRAKNAAGEKPVLEALHNHAVRCRDACERCGEPPESGWPPYLDQQFEAYSHYRFPADGNWFYQDFYQHRDRRTEKEVEDALDALRRLKKVAGKTVAELLGETLLPPSKYLVLLAADGDDMGKLLSELQCRKDHEQLSKVLVEFSTQHAPRVLERELPGYILYWGGDEGVAMLPLDDLPQALPTLRQAWKEHVENALGEQAPGASLTLSVGAVVFHHQFPLRSAIRQVFETLEKAKDRRGKDSWAVRILRRSGGPVEVAGPWEKEDTPCGTNNERVAFSPFDLMSVLIECHRDDILSPRWLADLRREETALGDPPDNLAAPQRDRLWVESRQLFDHEIVRIVRRHWRIRGSHLANMRRDLEQMLRCLNGAVSWISRDRNYKRFQEISCFLDLAHYIAKGGGR